MPNRNEVPHAILFKGSNIFQSVIFLVAWLLPNSEIWMIRFQVLNHYGQYTPNVKIPDAFYSWLSLGIIFDTTMVCYR